MKTVELIKSSPLYVGLASGLVLITGSSLLIPGVLPIAVGMLGLGGFTLGLLGASFEKKAKEIEIEWPEPRFFNNLSDNLKEQVVRLESIAKLHAKADTGLYPMIKDILVNSLELFQRINSKLDSQAHRLAAVNYTDMLKKLNRALDADYYLDIITNPNLWDNSAERLAAVDKAVEATEQQLLRNIRQVNASQDIDYAIALESLANSMEVISASEMTGEQTQTAEKAA